MSNPNLTRTEKEAHRDAVIHHAWMLVEGSGELGWGNEPDGDELLQQALEIMSGGVAQGLLARELGLSVEGLVDTLAELLT